MRFLSRQSIIPHLANKIKYYFNFFEKIFKNTQNRLKFA